MRRLAPRLPAAPLVWEPCVGGGSFVAAVRAHLPGAIVDGWDVDPEAPGRRLCDTFEARDARGAVRERRPVLWHLAITNPPFGREVGQRVTVEIVESMRSSATLAVALLPVEVQGQVGYADLVRACSDVWPLVGRPWPHLREAVVYVWDADHAGEARFEPLEWSS